MAAPEVMGSASWMQQADRYLMPTYRRHAVVLARGEGSYVWDVEGRRYLDMITGIGVNAVGHCHPRVVAAIRQQAATLLHASNLYYTIPQAELARLLVEHSPFDRVFFCNSGAEAIEAALKIARGHASGRGAGRFEVVTALGSFHGRTYGALTATGQPRYHEGFQPMVPGFVYVPFNDVTALRSAVGSKTAAILIEVVQGEGGVHPARPEFVAEARRLADEAGALLIVDEIQTGLGRTGRLFAFEHYGIVPDVVTLAKALGGGVAIGAVLARGAAATALGPGRHASTFGGNPLACAAALAAMQVILEEHLTERAALLGARLRRELERLAGRTGRVREVRGLGLMVAVELDGAHARAVADACIRRGLLLNAVGPSTLRMLPPLTAGEPEVDQAVAILEGAIGEIGGQPGAALKEA